jgi:hypothetical protein
VVASLKRAPEWPNRSAFVTLSDYRNSVFTLVTGATVRLCQQETWLQDLALAKVSFLVTTPAMLELIPEAVLVANTWPSARHPTCSSFLLLPS